jgi:plastocyanin domain-containing protein
MKTIGIILLSLAVSTTGFAKIYEVKVTEKGFEPSSLKVSKNENVVLKITRVTDSTCATKVQVPSLKVSKNLPLNSPVEIQLGKLKEEKVKFGCGMGMMLGGVIFSK